MRGAERPLRQQSGAGRHGSGHGVYLGGLEGLAQGQRWKHGGYALGHHGLAGAGRAYQQQVVSSGAGHLYGALDELLAADVGEVGVEVSGGLCEAGAGVYDGGGGSIVAAEEQGDGLGQAADAVDVDVVDDGGLGGVGFGDYEALQAHLAGLDGHGEDSADAEDVAAQGQLADGHDALHGVGGDDACGREDAQQHGEVVAGAPLADGGGGEVDDDALAGHGEVDAGALHGGGHALVALANCRVGQAYYGVADALVDERLDGDGQRVDALHGGGVYLGEHGGLFCGEGFVGGAGGVGAAVEDSCASVGHDEVVGTG